MNALIDEIQLQEPEITQMEPEAQIEQDEIVLAEMHEQLMRNMCPEEFRSSI